jgi:predicted DNA-binding protein (MmcQ/YjbR family)
MDIEQLRDYCFKKKGVTESLPFDDHTLVFKVGSKMFCLTNLDSQLKVNLKCEPQKSIELREEFEEIVPGYHMSKKHWNTIDLEGSLTNPFICELIDISYNLVYNKLTKTEKDLIKNDN